MAQASSTPTENIQASRPDAYMPLSYFGDNHSGQLVAQVWFGIFLLTCLAAFLSN